MDSETTAITGDEQFVRIDNDFHVMKAVEIIKKIVSASDAKSREVRIGLFFEGRLAGIIITQFAEALGFPLPFPRKDGFS